MGHEDVEVACVNHPRSPTRVRCVSCDSPICVQCMHETPVGMKCPACSKVEYRSRNDRRRYLAGGAGLLAATGATAFVVPLIGRFDIIVAGLLGLAVGALVRAVGRRRPGIGSAAAIATVCGMAMGLLVLGAGPSVLFGLRFWFPAGVAAGVAGFVASR